MQLCESTYSFTLHKISHKYLDIPNDAFPGSLENFREKVAFVDSAARKILISSHTVRDRHTRFTSRSGVFVSLAIGETLASPPPPSSAPRVVRKRLESSEDRRRVTGVGEGGMFIAGSYLERARVAAASHRTIFIIRPFVFSATVRPESNNSSPRRPRESQERERERERELCLLSAAPCFPFAADLRFSPAICFLSPRGSSLLLFLYSLFPLLSFCLRTFVLSARSILTRCNIYIYVQIGAFFLFFLFFFGADSRVWQWN